MNEEINTQEEEIAEETFSEDDEENEEFDNISD